MNELRWILLAAGVVVIAAIYLWESWKHKRDLRSRVDNYPGAAGDTCTDVHISPRKEIRQEKEMDLSAAADAFNSYLKRSRNNVDIDTPDLPAEMHVDDDWPADTENDTRENTADPAIGDRDERIIVIYIVASTASGIDGGSLHSALVDAGLQFGDMDIFHYYGQGDEFRQRALFSIANIHEPGTFNNEDMAAITTDGVAMFMCLPAPIGGDIAFEIMLDCARQLANRLGAVLQNEKHQILDDDAIERLRRIAGEY